MDFAGHAGVKIQTLLQPVTKHNIRRHLDRLNGLDWRKVDFRKFSKKYNNHLKDYDFSLDALLATSNHEQQPGSGVTSPVIPANGKEL